MSLSSNRSTFGGYKTGLHFLAKIREKRKIWKATANIDVKCIVPDNNAVKGSDSERTKAKTFVSFKNCFAAILC